MISQVAFGKGYYWQQAPTYVCPVMSKVHLLVHHDHVYVCQLACASAVGSEAAK